MVISYFLKMLNELLANSNLIGIFSVFRYGNQHSKCDTGKRKQKKKMNKEKRRKSSTDDIICSKR